MTRKSETDYVRVFCPGDIAVWIDHRGCFKGLVVVLERGRSGKLVVLCHRRVRSVLPSDLRHEDEIVYAVMAA